MGDVRFFDTLGAAGASNIPPGVDAVYVAGFARVGDHCGAWYRNVSSHPEHAGAFESRNGSWFELLPMQTWMPEMIGDGSGGVNWTSTFQDFAAAIQAVKPWRVSLAKDGEYFVASDADVAADDLTLMHFKDWHGFKFDFNNAIIKTAYSGSVGRSIQVLRFTGCTRFEVNDYAAQQTVLAGPSQTKGLRHITVRDGCSDFDIRRARFLRGVTGFAARRNLGSAEAHCKRFRVEAYAEDTGYPVSLQSTGSNSDIRIVSRNCDRTALIYNVKHVKLDIDSWPSNNVQDFVIEAKGHPDEDCVTEDIEFTYRSDHQIVGGGTMIDLQLSQADPAKANFANAIRNVRGRLAVHITNGFTFGLLTTSSKFTGGVYGYGDVNGADISNITIGGHIYGNLTAGGGDLFSIGAAAQGFSTNTRIGVSVTELEAYHCTVGSHIGPSSEVRFSGINAPDSALTIDAALPAKMLRADNCRFSGVGGGNWFSGIWTGNRWKHTQDA